MRARARASPPTSAGSPPAAPCSSRPLRPVTRSRVRASVAPRSPTPAAEGSTPSGPALSCASFPARAALHLDNRRGIARFLSLPGTWPFTRTSKGHVRGRTVSSTRRRGRMDKAPVYETGGWRFDPSRRRHLAVAQQDRALRSERRGRTFESCRRGDREGAAQRWATGLERQGGPRAGGSTPPPSATRRDGPVATTPGPQPGDRGSTPRRGAPAVPGGPTEGRPAVTREGGGSSPSLAAAAPHARAGEVPGGGALGPYPRTSGFDSRRRPHGPEALTAERLGEDQEGQVRPLPGPRRCSGASCGRGRSARHAGPWTRRKPVRVRPVAPRSTDAGEPALRTGPYPVRAEGSTRSRDHPGPVAQRKRSSLARSRCGFESRSVPDTLT